MGYRNLKPEEVIEIITEFQNYLTGDKEIKHSSTELLGALEYAKKTVELLKVETK